MIKGIINLFKSGFILSPMVLGGICAGIFFSYHQGLQLFYTRTLTDYNFYLICVAVALVYTFAFRPYYKNYDKDINFPATTRKFIGNAFILILSIVLTTILFGTLFL